MKHRCELRFRSHRACTHALLSHVPFALAGLFLFQFISAPGPSRATAGPGETFSRRPFGKKILDFFLERCMHFWVLYVSERRRGPKTSRGPG